MNRLRPVVAAAVAILTLASCTNGQGTNRGAAASPEVTPPTAAQSPVPPTLVQPSLGTKPQPSPPSDRKDCVASVEEATVRPDDTAVATCLIVGATLKITSAPAPRAAWQQLYVTDRAVLDCTSAVSQDGTVDGTCTARRAGDAVVWTTTLHRPGGPPDQPDYPWQLSVRVVS